MNKRLTGRTTASRDHGTWRDPSREDPRIINACAILCEVVLPRRRKGKDEDPGVCVVGGHTHRATLTFSSSDVRGVRYHRRGCTGPRGRLARDWFFDCCATACVEWHLFFSSPRVLSRNRCEIMKTGGDIVVYTQLSFR